MCINKMNREGQTIPLALEKISNYADSSSNNSIVFLIHLMNIFKKFVRGPQALTDYLVGQNVIKILCDALDYAKTFNTALAKVVSLIYSSTLFYCGVLIK